MEMNYNHEHAVTQMARELGCNHCIYFHPSEPAVCQRPDKKHPARIHSQTGQCEEIVRKKERTPSRLYGVK